jgi:CheY-like chemotaxis protein
MDPPARIVIVEDESITALHLAKRLRSLGYQVVALGQ